MLPPNPFSLARVRRPAFDHRGDVVVTILVVEGMGCRACATRVRGALLHAAGVLAADVDLERGLATVYSRQVVDTPSLAMNLQRIGRLAGQEYRLRHFATIRPMADVEDPAESAPGERHRSDGAAEQ